MNKKTLIAIGIGLLIILIVGLVIFVSKDDQVQSKNPNNDITNGNENTVVAPSKLSENEKNVKEKKREEIFEFIPKAYTEEIAPFTSMFMLDAVMSKIIEENEAMDFSVNNVDKYVIKLFGKDASIKKEEVTEPDITKSAYYYSKEAESYAVVPMGYQGIYKYQILKNVTETDDAYYVYTYTLVGGYLYDEDSITQDEFGDMDYENAKVQVIVGDKDGNDLVHIFDKYDYIYNDNIWLDKYSNIMPVFRYTLKKDNGNYYLTEVEQINY